MTKQETILAAHFLRMAADEFGNHGCNDFNLKRWIPDLDQRRALIKKYHEFNGDPEEYDPTCGYESFPDFALMAFMASRLNEGVYES